MVMLLSESGWWLTGIVLGVVVIVVDGQFHGGLAEGVAHGSGELPPGVERGLDAQTVYRDR